MKKRLETRLDTQSSIEGETVDTKILRYLIKNIKFKAQFRMLTERKFYGSNKDGCSHHSFYYPNRLLYMLVMTSKEVEI